MTHVRFLMAEAERPIRDVDRVSCVEPGPSRVGTRSSAPRPEPVPMPTSPPRRVPGRLLRAGLALAVMAATGCQGGTGVLRRWNLQNDPTLAKPITEDELGDNRNLVARWLSPGKGTPSGGTYNARQALAPTKPDPGTEAEIQAAEALFQQGKLAEAEAAFTRLERKTEKASVPIDDGGFASKEEKGAWSRVKGGQALTSKKRSQPLWGEKVLFYLAESQYQQGKFVAANTTYEKLLNNFPGSPHLEKAVAREYAIADSWLAAGESQPKGKDPSKPPGTPASPAKDDAVRTASWSDHFNGRMPLVDVDGHALKAMEHVRQHDPTGPLADDATLRIADHYFARGDYENASAHFEQLIKDHPKSALLQRAQIGLIDSELKGYLGPEYDAAGLEKAAQTIRQTMTSFPDRPAALTEKLYHDLDLIADQQAAIAFHNGQFYKRTGYASGAEYYFGEVRARWPKSPWAEKAQAELASLAKMPRKKADPSRILTLPGAPDPNAAGSSMGSMSGGGMGMPAGSQP